MYSDVNLKQGNQFVNISQPLITDDNFNGVLNSQETTICNSIQDKINFYDDNVLVYDSINNIIQEYKDHFISHSYIIDYSCKICTEMINFTNSPNGQVICEVIKSVL